MSFSLAVADVYRVARGYNADGSRRVGRPLSFPTREETLTAVAFQVLTLYTFIAAEHPDALQDAAKRTALVIKFMAHLTRCGRMRPHLIEASADEVAMAGVILAEHPHLISEPVSFASIVARYEQFLAACKRSPTTLKYGRPAKPNDVPSRPVVWTSADSTYQLQELVHPWHLVEETDALGHCLGRPDGNNWTGKDDLWKLAYWRLIATGRSRVFSLGLPNFPLCTLHVSVPLARLTEIQGRPGHSLVIPSLFQAVDHLRSLFPRLSLDDDLPFRLVGTLGLSSTSLVLAELRNRLGIPSASPPQ